MQEKVYIYSNEKQLSKQTILMSDKISLSLQTLPVELVYRILDNLDVLTIFLTFRNICVRLNKIMDTYHRYKVCFTFIISRIRKVFNTSFESIKEIPFSKTELSQNKFYTDSVHT